jgi:mono/diheme cytochrome c family protein
MKRFLWCRGPLAAAALAVTAAILPVALPGSGARSEEAPSGDTANGRRLYLAVGCFECHGRAGQGGAFNGPSPALAHTALPFEAFQAQLRNPSSDMPAYSALVMSDKELADVFAFVRSLPAGRKGRDIPLLNE